MLQTREGEMDCLVCEEKSDTLLCEVCYGSTLGQLVVRQRALSTHLYDALDRYGRHDVTCYLTHNPGEAPTRCDCGLTLALRRGIAAGLDA